jgi:hypothetical protein
VGIKLGSPVADHNHMPEKMALPGIFRQQRERRGAKRVQK